MKKNNLCSNKAVAPENGLASKRVSIRKIIALMAVMIMAAALCVSPAFAAPTPGVTPNPGEAIQQGVNMGLKQIYLIITAVCVPIAVVVVAFAAIKIFTGGEKGMQQAKTIFISVGVALGVIYLAPIVIQQVAGWFSSYSDTNVFGS